MYIILSPVKDFYRADKKTYVVFTLWLIGILSWYLSNLKITLNYTYVC